MRHVKCLIIFLLAFFPRLIFAQGKPVDDIDITGLWKGTLYNDSTQQDYKYEIGISEEKGKLSGFTHTWYNDKDYFVVKKVKIKKTDGKIIIEDVDIIAYNYPESPPKGVRRLHVLTLQPQDSILVLSGIFSTNRTKQFAPATGTVNLQRKNDFRKHSDLMAHLQELQLDEKLSFVAKEIALAKQEEEKILTKTAAAVVPSPAKTAVKEIAINAPDTKKVEIKPIPESKRETKQKAAVEARTSPVTKNAAPAAEVLTRRNVLQETMFFKTDSLELSLYDNGEVDGDTVSVLMNGQILMAKQRLSTNAIRKTIYIPDEMDSVELVMYAENLGTLPPNSGLLVVRDGRDTYEIRFSGDLQKNAAVILKRRKK